MSVGLVVVLVEPVPYRDLQIATLPTQQFEFLCLSQSQSHHQPYLAIERHTVPSLRLRQPPVHYRSTGRVASRTPRPVPGGGETGGWDTGVWCPSECTKCRGDSNRLPTASEKQFKPQNHCRGTSRRCQLSHYGPAW